MTGANYMGGKRNAARARTRDSMGRLQKRHFGQQRLAAALCTTREEKGNPRKMTLESALHEINLAPAQRDPKILGGVPSTTQTGISYNPPSTYKVIAKRRKLPSKILQALDFSDPMSYRHAIDRILSIPLSEMLGLHVREKAPHAQDEGSSDSTKELLSIDDDVESNIQTSSYIHSEVARSSTPASQLFSLDPDDGFQNHKGGFYDDHLSEANLHSPSPDQHMDARHGLPWSVEVDGPKGNFVNDSGYADMDVTETGSFRGSILTPDLLGPQRHISPSSNSFPFSFCSGSQGTEEYILDMDTSPPSSPGSFVCPIPFDASPAAISHSPNYDPFLQQSPSRATSLLGSPAPMNSLESFGWDYSVKSNSPQHHGSTSGSSQKSQFIFPSLHPAGGSASCDEQFQHPYPTEHVYTYSSSSGNSSYGISSFSDSDIHDTGLPLDIINDPDPWATIGKILNLENVEERNDDDVNFTRGREGVGYVRQHLDKTVQKSTPRRSLNIYPPQSVEGECEGGPQVTINDEVKEDSDHGQFIRYQSQHAQDSQLEGWPSPDDFTDSSLVYDINSAEQNKSLCTSTVVESQMPTESPLITTALAYQVSPLLARRGANGADMFEGPCLFVDSEGEDE